MGISRDEIREIAVTALLLAVALRIASGVVQLIEELDRSWTLSSALGRLLAPVGSTMGILALGAVLIGVLSPTGSVDGRLLRVAGLVAGVVALLGLASAINSFSLGFSAILSRIWFSLLEPLAATLLGGTGWWISRNFEPQR